MHAWLHARNRWDPVLGVGFENFYLTQDEPNLKRSDATHDYGNMDPAGAMNGILFKWAVNGWVHGIHTEMTGSHPIVTEEAKNLTITGNYLDGAWNIGKGGRGYFRGSRVWDSVYAGNISRNLRHFTFQWSASGNVAIGNDLYSDLNLHGGYERNNLFELNTVHVPYAHRSANCTVNCGEEGGGGTNDSDWYPIWWAAGPKAVKRSGSSGYRNVFFDNTMTKRLDNDVAGPIVTFYSEPHRIFEFGWDGTAFHHLDVGGPPISDWAHNETNNLPAFLLAGVPFVLPPRHPGRPVAPSRTRPGTGSGSSAQGRASSVNQRAYMQIRRTHLFKEWK